MAVQTQFMLQEIMVNRQVVCKRAVFPWEIEKSLRVV